jgi:hypothetical protein|tara:strand:+ start:569 stop:850 length:282 start_codon:yes stop_codon:yes gene_type:complete
MTANLDTEARNDIIRLRELCDRVLEHDRKEKAQLFPGSASLSCVRGFIALFAEGEDLIRSYIHERNEEWLQWLLETSRSLEGDEKREFIERYS